MNLIQIQDQLKSLPSDPRTMQALTAYANGANPAVPPYLALGELNRRKQLMEKAQAAQASQPPQGTVKDQVEQQAGIMALQQGRQQQAMQQAMQMGAQAAQGAPSGIPQPQEQGTVQAASGGLMALLADRARARRMASGGIISFAPAGSVDAAIEDAYANSDEAVGGGGAAPDESGDDEASAKVPVTSDEARKLFAQLQLEAAKRRAEKGPEYSSPIEAEEALMKKYPERFAALRKEPGAEALSRLEELQAAQRAELAKQREESAAAKPGILQLLGQAAMQSRGQQGRSALASILGGYSQLQTGADAAALKQEQELRMRDLQLQDVRREAMDKVEEIKRAKAEGDVNREMKAKQDFAKILKDNNVSFNTLLGRQLTSAASLAGAERGAQARELAAREATKRKGISAPSERMQMLNRIQDLRDAGKSDEAEALAEDYRKLFGGTAAVGELNTQRKLINDKIRGQQAIANNFSNPAEVRAAARERIVQLNEELNRLPVPGKTPTAAPPTAAPTGAITPAEFDAQWAKLQPGQTLVGPDGVTYTKRKEK